MKRFTYYSFRFLVFIFAIIPFRCLYFFSWLMFLIVYHFVGYRKKIVLENLRNSFPGKTEKEIKKISRGFYFHIADVVIESMKAFTMTEKAVCKRYRFLNADFLDDIYRRNQSVLCVAGHFNNWEWGGIATGTQVLHKPVGFYQPLSNKYIDNYIQHSRVQGRSVLASVMNTSATFQKDWEEPVIYYMVADQSPSSPRLAYWVKFLNQDTATLHGPEKYARIYNFPVVYADVQKVKRGYYTVEFKMLCENPAQTKTGEITGKFMQMLEQKIIENPQFYLWSHRRWKLKR